DPEGSLKESVIAIEVFDRAPDYDPQIDSIVRVEIGRLRSRLAEYYGQTLEREPVKIEIPKGGYRPSFVVREPLLTPASPVAEPATPKPEPKPWLLQHPRAIATAAVLLLALLGVAAWIGASAKRDAGSSIAVLPFLNLSGDPAN